MTTTPKDGNEDLHKHSNRDKSDDREMQLEGWDKESLYNSGILRWFHLPTLAQLWLEELKNVGLQKTDQSSGAPLKQSLSFDYDHLAASPTGGTYPVRLDNGQVLWVQIDTFRTEEGYRYIEVLDQPSQTDKAIVAALTALEVTSPPINIKRLRKTLSLLKTPLKQRIKDYMVSWKRFETHPWDPIEVHEEHKRRVQKTPEGAIESSLGGEVRNLEYVVALLRYYRPGFDSLAHKEQLALIERACGYVNDLLDALRKLIAFLEHGKPRGLPNKIVKGAQRDVLAAMLKDVEGLSNPEIGERLNIPPTEFDIDKGDHEAARKMVQRGRSLLEKALGKEGWEKQVQVMIAEAERWHSLNEEEQDIEQLADALGKPTEEIRQDGEEWRQAKLREQERIEQGLLDDPEAR